MNCKEYLSIIEEYVEGELDERTAGFVTAHMAGCEACARAYEELQREQEMYADFLGDVKESPALWSAVRAGLEKEKAVNARQTVVPTRFWFSRPLGYPRFSLVFALTLLLIGIGFGLVRLISSHRRATQELAVSSRPGGASPLQNQINRGNPLSAGTGVTASDNTARTPPKRIRQRDGLSKRLLAKSNFGRSNRNPDSVLAPLPKANAGELLALNAAMNDQAQRRLKFSSLVDSETARHLEKSEVMLRSFRNMMREVGAPTYDISYERRLSRELLIKNILLRRNAEARGEILTENLLNRLEPFLLDIANLQDRTSETDLRLIEQRIGEKQIIATLKVYIG